MMVNARLVRMLRQVEVRMGDLEDCDEEIEAALRAQDERKIRHGIRIVAARVARSSICRGMLIKF